MGSTAKAKEEETQTSKKNEPPALHVLQLPKVNTDKAFAASKEIHSFLKKQK